MSIDLAVWKWNPRIKLPTDVVALHAAFDRGEAHPALVRFDVTAFEEALNGLYDRAGMKQAPWTYVVQDRGPDRPNWVRFTVDIAMVQLFPPRLVELACVHELVVSDPYKNHIIGA